MGLKLLFMGTPRFALCSLAALLKTHHHILGVVVQPDRPKGRGRKPGLSPVKALATEQGIPVYQPEKVGEEAFLTEIRRLPMECIVVVAYGHILPPALLKMPPLGCFNLHGSLLPKYRGAAPINWAIINGDSTTGVTIIKMDEGLDTGDILCAKEVPISYDDTAETLHDKLASEGAAILVKALDQLEQGRAVLRPQDHSKATYAPMLRKEDGRIDWSRSADYIRNQIRGMNPWPVAFTTLSGKLLRIFKADAESEVEFHAVPGEVIQAEGPILRVQTGQGRLLLKELQLESRKRLDVEAFLRGTRLIPGTVLGQ